MKLRKLSRYALMLAIVLPLLFSFNGCQASYQNMRRVSKGKKVHARQHKHAKSVRQTKRKSNRPINTNYVVKSKKRRSYHY